MTDRSESCTKLFFETYKAIGKQQWINAVHRADWTEGRAPVVSGVTDLPAEVCSELRKYYEMLFSEKVTQQDAKARIFAKLKKKKIAQVFQQRNWIKTYRMRFRM